MCRTINDPSAKAFFGQGVVAKCTPEASSVLAKTKMCKFFFRGKCTRGTACTFAHSQSDLHTQPDLFRTEMCHQFMQTGTCKYGDRCTFAHTADQLRPSVPNASAPTIAAPVWTDWAMPDVALGSFMYCFTDDLHANLFTLGDCPASAETFMHTDSFASPASMLCVSASVDREAWCDPEYGDSASTSSLLATVESDGDAETSESSDDEEDEVDMQVVVERTFVTMKVAGTSHRAAVAASGAAAARRRAVSAPPRERQL